MSLSSKFGLSSKSTSPLKCGFSSGSKNLFHWCAEKYGLQAERNCTFETIYMHLGWCMDDIFCDAVFYTWDDVFSICDDVFSICNDVFSICDDVRFQENFFY